MNRMLYRSGGGSGVVSSDYIPDLSDQIVNTELYKGDVTVDYITDPVTYLSVTTASVYAIYDALVADFPNYVSKETLGLASDGTPLYLYKFIPPKSHLSLVEKKRIFIGAGIHGTERNCIWTAATFFDNLCRNWQNSAGLESLRWSVGFEVIPIINPYGVDNLKYTNANQVNLNRNFPFGWVNNAEPGELAYAGPHAASEPETQVLIQYMEAAKDRIFFAAGLHNLGNYPDSTQVVMWLATGDQSIFQVCNGFAASVDAKFYKMFNFSDNLRETSFLQTRNETFIAGSETHWHNLGVKSCLFEFASDVVVEGDTYAPTITGNKLSQENMGNFLLTVLRYIKS